ncbi:HK97 family phage prohead protease [Neiella sp. HB171785]|uniref:HK97 family phage prohead protease n=1 Tax=Neiella litorisoli TaxID=2771431 RepID=A0A8J6QT50_9GAMM|nr:HK97 family phage prohead protease [Neiella litorisoli]MBD1388432.1 HK97 family phage prohead protease [Neiella litorisoli]
MKIRGTAAAYYSNSRNLGGFIEMIKPSAFKQSLKKADVRCLSEHDPQNLLGRTSSGTLRLQDTKTGLQFECDLPDTTTANDLSKLIERGDLRGCSFRMRVLNSEWDFAGKVPLRIVTEAEIDEITMTATPAYLATDCEVISDVAV